MEIKKLENILLTFYNIEKKLSSLGNENYDEYAKLSKEYSDLKPLVEKSKEFLKLKEELNDIDELLVSDDQEMRREAEEEKVILKKKISLLEEELKVLLIPKDEEDERNAIIEIRAGTERRRVFCS